MNKFFNKNLKIWLLVALMLFVSWMSYPYSVFAGTLSCTVRTSSCNAGEIEVFEMQNTSNSHAGMPSASYTNLVCCGGITGISSLCSGTFATALKLSGVTNAHGRAGTLADYAGANNACISVPSGGSISVAYQATNCTGYDTTIASMIGTTNSHVGNSAWAAGTTKICGTGAASVGLTAQGTLSSSVFDTGVTGSVGYNSIMWKGALGTGSTGKVRFQLATAAVSTGPWSFVGGTTCGSSDWFDPGGPDIPIELKTNSCSPNPGWNNNRYFRYKVQVCSNDCSSGGTYTPTVNGIIVNWSS